MSYCSSHFSWWPWVNLAFTQTWPYWCLVSFLDDSPLHYMVSKSLSPSTGGTIIVSVQTTGKMYFRFSHRDGGSIPRRKLPLSRNWLVATPRLVLELNSPISGAKVGLQRAPARQRAVCSLDRGDPRPPRAHIVLSSFCCQRSVQRSEVSIVCHTQTHCDWRALWLAQDRASRLYSD